jgi:beta-aspartyl-peptidase (threonine type)
MKSKFTILLSFLLFVTCKQNKTIDKINLEENTTTHFALIIHGGAGYIENLPSELETAYKEKMQESLQACYKVLEQGGTAIEAVRVSINILEDSPLFNAGKGCVLNSLGKPEMDASIMFGKDLSCGAVAGVSHIKNPINAAILVKDSTRHVLLSGEGAEIFCKQFGIQMEDETYFVTEKRLKQLKRIQSKEKETAFIPDRINDVQKYGTVGCVALDKNGNIAAGTSTGGLMNKQFGRIGDSPIIGAGTYADNNTCGISCTGTGEYFIRTSASHMVSDLLQYKKISLKEAQKISIEKIQQLGGDGGMIGIDKSGNIAWYFNTKGMFRAYKKSTGEEIIKMYGE